MEERIFFFGNLHRSKYFFLMLYVLDELKIRQAIKQQQKKSQVQKTCRDLKNHIQDSFVF